jgi:4,5-dihydroxyphthalate decarboxylase
MSRLEISLACTRSDRTAAILDGRVEVKGCALIPLPGEAEEIFVRALQHREFDVTEMSLSSHVLVTSRGDAPYVGLPVFPSRSFRHSSIYVRTDRGIERPEDLAGRTLGVPEFQMTAALWIRGILADYHGVPPSDITWRTGGLEVPGLKERIAISVREGIDVAPIPADRSLSALFASGELDGIIAPRLPSCVAQGQPGVARLFPDFRSAEAAFYRQSGMFPIMHVLAVRRELAERHPWLAGNIFRAFAEAKQVALAELDRVNFLPVMDPWFGANVAQARELMGSDFWPYGVGRNLKELSAVARWSYEEGLAERLLSPQDLFHPATVGLSG